MPSAFRLVSPFEPQGDQPRAIRQLVDGVQQDLALDPTSRAIGDYALGRGHLGLGDAQRARTHLERSWQS